MHYPWPYGRLAQLSPEASSRRQLQIKAAHLIASKFLTLKIQLRTKNLATPRKSSKSRQDFLRRVSLLPQHALHVYTDGSSFGNPGDSGAGVFITSPTQLASFLSFSLGRSTNNAAELEGILKALLHLYPCLANQRRPPRVYIFVDNQYAINVSTQQWTSRSNRPLVAQIHKALSRLRTLTEVFIMWVPGHAHVYGNEVADTLAKRGARGVSSSAPLPVSDLTALKKGKPLARSVDRAQTPPLAPTDMPPPQIRPRAINPKVRKEPTPATRTSSRDRGHQPLFPGLTFTNNPKRSKKNSNSSPRSF